MFETAFGLAMRPETTDGSYTAAVNLLRSGAVKAPVCVWQAGKSYRTEKNDGATAARLRFNEFWQLEFQCIFPADSKATAQYIQGLTFAVHAEIQRFLMANQCRLVSSDRLPAYSTSTTDIEVKRAKGWKEVASLSSRTDFPLLPGRGPLRVFEVAIGLDRLVEIEGEK